MRRDPARALTTLQRHLTFSFDRLMGELARGEISGRAFVERSRILLEEAHESAARLGQIKAGLGHPTGDAARLARRVAVEEIQFLRGVSRDLADGRYRMRSKGGEGAKRRKARATLYALKLTGTANEAWLEALGDQETRWVLGETEGDQHCPECQAEAAHGWLPARRRRRMPADGSTSCITRCACSLETRDGKQGFANP